jgi:Flp pilus assembly protein TadG
MRKTVMKLRKARSRNRRGTTLVESAMALLVFAVMLAGIMELGVVGFAFNSVSFAAQRAARYAAVRGSASGHPASESQVRATALSYSAPLKSEATRVTVTWTPDNHPGSTVAVTVAYDFTPWLLPLSHEVLTVAGTARQAVTQ